MLKEPGALWFDAILNSLKMNTFGWLNLFKHSYVYMPYSIKIGTLALKK